MQTDSEYGSMDPLSEPAFLIEKNKGDISNTVNKNHKPLNH